MFILIHCKFRVYMGCAPLFARHWLICFYKKKKAFQVHHYSLTPTKNGDEASNKKPDFNLKTRRKCKYELTQFLSALKKINICVIIYKKKKKGIRERVFYSRGKLKWKLIHFYTFSASRMRRMKCLESVLFCFQIYI